MTNLHKIPCITRRSTVFSSVPMTPACGRSKFNCEVYGGLLPLSFYLGQRFLEMLKQQGQGWAVYQDGQGVTVWFLQAPNQFGRSDHYPLAAEYGPRRF